MSGAVSLRYAIAQSLMRAREAEPPRTLTVDVDGTIYSLLALHQDFLLCRQMGDASRVALLPLAHVRTLFLPVWATEGIIPAIADSQGVS